MSATSVYSRRLLLHSPLTMAAPPPPVVATGNSSPSSSSTSEQYPGDSSFDANVVMVLSVLLCALICSLGLNSIIRCALRCSTFVSASGSSSESGSDSRSAQSSAAAAANTGVKKKALKTFPTVSFSSDLNLPGLDAECAICLSEFAAGDRLRLLPKCNHGFHARCIDKWLNSHSSCPKCRHNLLQTCQKIVGAASSSEQFPAVQDPAAVVLAVSPLEPEGPIRSHRGNS